MPAQAEVEPWWAALTVWGVVNAVNVLQARKSILVPYLLLFFGAILA